MITIEDLKALKTFVLEEKEIVDDVPSKTKVLSSYTFIYEEKKEEKHLFITGDVFGTKRYKVINSLETLFNIAKKRELKINIEKKFDLRISNYTLVVK